MIVQKLPVMTPEQRRRQDLQVQWLISALRRMSEPRIYAIDLQSLDIAQPRRQALVEPDAD